MPKRKLDVWELRALLLRECKKAGGQRTWATSNNVSPQYVNDVLNERREPGESICRALGYAKKPAEYVPRPDAWDERKPGKDPS